METLVINLDRRHDRLQRIHHHLLENRIDFRRIPAIDWIEIEEDDQSLVSPGMRACWQSHRSALRVLCDSPSNFGLILEDDTVLAEDTDWPQFLDDIETQMVKFDLDFLQLGYLQSQYSHRLIPAWLDRRKQERTLETLEFQMGSSRETAALWALRAGAHAYVASQRFALAVHQLNQPTWLSPDGFFEFLARSQQIFLDLRMARMIKSFAHQWARPGIGAALDSDIDASSRTQSP